MKQSFLDKNKNRELSVLEIVPPTKIRKIKLKVLNKMILIGIIIKI